MHLFPTRPRLAPSNKLLLLSLFTPSIEVPLTRLPPLPSSVSKDNCMAAMNLLQLLRGRYHRQQNKWYPQRCLLGHFEATFATAKVECSFEMGHLWGTIYFAVDGTESLCKRKGTVIQK